MLSTVTYQFVNNFKQNETFLVLRDINIGKLFVCAQTWENPNGFKLCQDREGQLAAVSVVFVSGRDQSNVALKERIFTC